MPSEPPIIAQAMQPASAHLAAENGTSAVQEAYAAYTAVAVNAISARVNVAWPAYSSNASRESVSKMDDRMPGEIAPP